MGDRAKFDIILGGNVSAKATKDAAALDRLTKAFTSTSAAARAYVATPGFSSVPGAVGVRARASSTGATSAARTQGFDANGKAAKAIERATAADASERRRIGEGIARAGAKADKEDAKRAADRARASAAATAKTAADRVQAANDAARTADRVRRAVQAAQAQTAGKDAAAAKASERAGRAAFGSRSSTGRGAGITQRLSAGVRGAGGRTAGPGSGLLGSFTRAGMAVQGVTMLAGAAARGARAFADLSFEAAGAYVNVATFRGSSISALTAVTGSAAQARAAFRDALVMANQTPMDSDETVRMQQRLIIGGFSDRGQRNQVMAGAADVGAAVSPRAMESFIEAMTLMRGRGSLSNELLTNQFATANLDQGKILDSIARQMNLRGATETARRAAARKAISGRRVSADVGRNAALDAVRGQFDRGGQLGSFARSRSQDLGGALSNARNAMFNLLAFDDLENSPGILSFKNGLLAVTNALDMTSQTGGRVRGVITSIGDAVGTGLFGGINDQSVKGAFDYMLPVMEGAVGILRTTLTLGKAFVTGFLPGLRVGIYPLMAGIRSFGGASGNVDLLAKGFRGLGRGIGFLVGGAATLTAFGFAIVGALTGPAVFIASLPGMFAGAAYSVVEGFAQAIEAGRGRIEGAIRSTFGEGVVGVARSVLGWHSPSTVFMAAGEAVSQGFGMGVDGGRGGARDAITRLLGMPGAAGAGGGAGALGGAKIELHFHIDGAGQSAEAIVDMAVEKFTDLIEGHSLMGAPAVGATG